MATTNFKGTTVNTRGQLPNVGDQAPQFTLTQGDLSDVNIDNFAGTNIVMNIFPSVDTGVCATSVRKFNEVAASLENTKVLCISRDLPFAQKRFCGAEGIENVTTLSELRNSSFGENYGVTLTDGPLAGLHTRAVIVIDATGKVVYTELVSEITEEPNYDQAIASVKSL